MKRQVAGEEDERAKEEEEERRKKFDAIGEHTGAGHNYNIMIPFDGESLGSEGLGRNFGSLPASPPFREKLRETGPSHHVEELNRGAQLEALKDLQAAALFWSVRLLQVAERWTSDYSGGVGALVEFREINVKSDGILTEGEVRTVGLKRKVGGVDPGFSLEARLKGLDGLKREKTGSFRFCLATRKLAELVGIIAVPDALAKSALRSDVVWVTTRDVLDPMTKSVRRSEVVWSTSRPPFPDMRAIEMFRWERPDDLPPSEPSEDAIWEVIDRHDPQGSVDVQDRLEQHQDMLQGRDTFHSFFTRFPLLPECSENSVEFEDPDRWVTSLRLQYGEYHPLESSVVQVSWGICDVLAPAADTVEPVTQSSLLSHRQLQSAPLEWSRDSTFGQVQSPVSGYVSWARYILRVHRGALQEAGIYEAFYASLFDYGRLPTSLARGLAEFWDAKRGTFWVGAEELTVTLSDLHTVSGLPIFGHRFEERVPPDEQLFRREEYLSSFPASLDDPFDCGLQHGTLLSEETAEPSSPTGFTSPGLVGVDERLLLAGFLALWLSTFVLPLRTGSLRCSVLLAAGQLSKGQRLALARAGLARESVLPWQYLYAWVYLHVQEAFSCLETPVYLLQRGFPTVLQLSQASSTFDVSLPPHLRGTAVVDGVDDRGRRTLLLHRQGLTIAEYLISLRPGWLCHRQGGFVTLEGYQSNRVVRQFRFSHATTYDGRPLVPAVSDVRQTGTVPPETRFYAATLTWLHLLRLGTCSSFLLAQPSVHTGVSYTRLAWVRQSFRADLEHRARRYECRVRVLGLPRGQRSRRVLQRLQACTATGTVVHSPARASDVAPASHHTEVSRSSRRQAGSQRALSSGRSVDARPSPGDLAESSQEPRRSDFIGYSTPGPSSDFSFLVDPYGIDQRSSESWVGFTSSADRLLGLFADFGVDTTELAFWEAVCREAESCIWQLRSLSVARARVTLPQLEEMVASRRAISDDTNDRLDRSAEALRRHRQSSSGMAQEVDGLTAWMQELWRDIRQMMSRIHHLQEMIEADSLLAWAVEQFQRAQSEFQTLNEVTGRLQSLRDLFGRVVGSAVVL
ncbi:hypothetical protein M5K25_011596 [Dendrobium thyrsiflorum]|uniref:Aminotransferase-like plant mobile domain-containing protein n=1 Tax=Dendrobium thyrsiflorum TaxID=117978 RepID=A0ABD0V3G5_DENTH